MSSRRGTGAPHTRQKARTTRFKPGEGSSLASRRFNPLTAFKTADISSTQSNTSSQQSKGKGKAMNYKSHVEDLSDALWVDHYEPSSEAELAVHARKVEDVRRWFKEAFEGGPSGKLKAYRRILALTGPAGTAKTTTVKILAREMGFEILEWRNTVNDSSPNVFTNEQFWNQNGDFESHFSKFETFLHRGASCSSIAINVTDMNVNAAGSSQSTQSSSTESSHHLAAPRHIILLEELPNILHSETKLRFHAALRSLMSAPPSDPPIPIVIIVSDAGVRGETEDQADRRRLVDQDGAVDIRTILPRDLLVGPYVTTLVFNPVAPTLLHRALQALLKKHFASSASSPPSRDVLDVIVEASNGDIRSAIMSLQFACSADLDNKKKGKKRLRNAGLVSTLESIARREQTLFLFHLLGKVLYNKTYQSFVVGKGDAPSSSAGAKDAERERSIDARLIDPPNLPPHLQEHERRASRVDVNELYANSPIDSSLFSLYVHQNYLDFCDNIEHCEGIIETLSWTDANGGESWYQANPHRFHILTLGTVHSLPSPVARRSQKIFKPAYFDHLQKEKAAWEGVRDTQEWVLNEGLVRDGSMPLGGWSQSDVVLKLGGFLRARDQAKHISRPPITHRLHSSLVFTREQSLGQTMSVNAREMNADEEHDELADRYQVGPHSSGGSGSGWLDSDDIEEF